MTPHLQRHALEDFDALADQYILAAKAPATRACYRSGWKRFVSFAKSIHRNPIVDPRRAESESSRVLEAFVVHLSGATGEPAVNSDTIRTYLTAVRHVYMSTGLPDPTDRAAYPRVRLALEGVARKHPHVTVRRAGVTRDMLLSIGARHDGTRSASTGYAIILGLHACLRAGDVVPQTAHGKPPLARKHVEFLTDVAGPHVVITVFGGKTDQLQQGIEVRLDPVPNSYACPTRALRKALAAGPRRGHNDPLFQTPDGGSVTRAMVQDALRAEASRRHLDPATFTGHSLRIGCTNLLLGAGYPLTFVQNQGAWASDAVKLYIRKSFARIPRSATNACPDKRYPCLTIMRANVHPVDLHIPDALCERMGG